MESFRAEDSGGDDYRESIKGINRSLLATDARDAALR
jgi:hypothetical protein